MENFFKDFIGFFFSLGFFDKALLVLLICFIISAIFIVFSFLWQFFLSLPLRVYDVLETIYFWLKIFLKQFVWWRLFESSEWIPIQAFFYKKLFSEERDLRERLKRYYILRFLRYIYLVFLFSFKFIKAYLLYFIIEGYFSTILLPSLLFLYSFFFFLKKSLVEFFYKVFWRSTVLFKAHNFVVKSMDQVYAFLTTFLGVFFRDIKYDSSYKSSFFFVRPPFMEEDGLDEEDVPVKWSGNVTSRVLYFASFFRPIDKDFFVKFNPEFSKMGVLKIVVWLFFVLVFFFIYGFVWILNILAVFFSWILYFVNFCFVVQFLKFFLFLDNFTFFKLFKGIIFKCFIFFRFLFYKLLKLGRFLNFYLFFLGFIFILKNILRFILKLLFIFFKTVFRLRFVLFLFIFFLFVGPFTFVYLFFSWVTLVINYWTSLFFFPIIDFDPAVSIFMAKYDAIMSVKYVEVRRANCEAAFKSFWFIWYDLWKWKEKIFSFHFLVGYSWLRWKYIFYSVLPIEWIVYRIKIFGFILLFLIDFIFIDAPTAWIMYVLNLLGFFDSRIFFFLQWFVWFVWNHTKMFIFLSCSSVWFYSKEFMSMWLETTVYTKDIVEFLVYSNFGLTIRWFFFYSFFDFFNKSFFYFLYVMVMSFSRLGFFLAIFHDFFGYFLNFFLDCWFFITDVTFFDLKTGFYWFYYFWAKSLVFWDWFCINFKIKSFSLDHLTLRNIIFLIHENDFLLGNSGGSNRTTIFNFIAGNNKKTNGFYTFIFIYENSFHYMLHIHVPIKHLVYIMQNYMFDSFFIFWIFFFSCLVFRGFLLLFSMGFEVSGNSIFYWFRFRDLNMNEVIPHLTEVPDFIRNRLKTYGKKGGVSRLSGSKDKEWEFWAFPLGLLKRFGKVDIDAVIMDKILQEKSLEKRLFLKHALKTKAKKGDINNEQFWSWLLGRFNLRALEDEKSRLKYHKLGYKTGFMNVGSKIYGADGIKTFDTIDFDFSYYYFNDDYADYNDMFRYDFVRFYYLIAYLYSKQSNIKYMYLYESDLERLSTENNVIAKEKSFYVEKLFNYFYKLDRDIFNYKMPYWSFHRDMELHLPVLSVMPKNNQSKPKMRELYWITDEDPVFLVWLIWWAVLFPVCYFCIRGHLTNFDPIWNIILNFDIKLLGSSILTSIEWPEFFYELIGYGSFNQLDDSMVPNSPRFRSYYLHPDYNSFLYKTDYGYKWHNQMIQAYRGADLKGTTNWEFCKNEGVEFMEKMWILYGYHPDCIHTFFIYKLLIMIHVLMVLYIIIKNKKKKNLKLLAVKKQLRFRQLRFRQLRCLELYFLLKKDLRNGFLWFWR